MDHSRLGGLIDRCFERAALWYERTDRWVLSAELFLAAMVFNGVWATPNINAWMEMAQSPFRTPQFGGNSYVLETPIGALLAHALHADLHSYTYAAVHFVVLVAFLAVTVVLAGRIAPGSDKVVAALFFAAPISTVTLTWLGQPDVFTIGLGALLVFFRRNAAIAAVAFLVIFAHPEQGVIMAMTISLVAAPLLGANRWNHLAATVAGLVAGKLAYEAYHARYHIHVPGTRVSWLSDNGALPPLQDSFRWWPVLLVMLFAAAWPLVAWWIATYRNWAVPVAFAVMIPPILLVNDHSRGFAVMSWPLLLAMTCRTCRDDPRRGSKIAVALVALRLIVPPVLVGTSLYGPAYARMIY